MRTLTEILESVIKSYNNSEVINFVDLRDLDGKINNELFNDLVDSYNSNQTLNFIQVRNLDLTVNN